MKYIFSSGVLFVVAANDFQSISSKPSSLRGERGFPAQETCFIKLAKQATTTKHLLKSQVIMKIPGCAFTTGLHQDFSSCSQSVIFSNDSWWRFIPVNYILLRQTIFVLACTLHTREAISSLFSLCTHQLIHAVQEIMDDVSKRNKDMFNIAYW